MHDSTPVVSDFRSRWFDLEFYALRRDGEHGGASLGKEIDWDGQIMPARHVVNDNGASRFAEVGYLLEK